MTLEGFMHALLITFHTTQSIADVADRFADYAVALRRQAGFVSKTWFSTEEGFGGFHLFVDQSSADAYLDTPLAAGLMGTEAFRQFDVKHFEVLTDLSALTAAPSTVA